MRPNLPFLSAASNAILKPSGPLKWKMRLVKDVRQGALIRLERSSEHWCLPLNPRKYEASFISVDPYQANLQLSLLLFNSRLHFNPTPAFLGSPLTAFPSFSKDVTSLKTKFFPRLKALRCILPNGATLMSPSLFCMKLFFGLFSRMLHPDGFLF